MKNWKLRWTSRFFFVNKPEMILDLKELASRFPNIFEDVHVEMRKGAY